LKKIIGLMVKPEVEKDGLDIAWHKGIQVEL
jgi:hypothetical protein